MLPIHYSLFITMLRNKLRLMIKKNKMKNTIKQLGICLVLSALSLLPVLTACSDNDDEPAAPEIVISENILTNGMNFSKTGGTSTLSIKSNVSLEVISNQDWCTVTPAASASATVLRKS